MNWDVPPGFELPYPPKLDADECMDEGRSIRRYNARYNLASMKFNTFAKCLILRLPRLCRVAEKDLI